MRYAMVMILAGALAVPVAGCKDKETSTCGRFCKAAVSDHADCLADHGCTHVDEGACVQGCVRACGSAMNRIDDRSRAEAEACIDCVHARVGSSPRCGEIDDAAGGPCREECDEGMGEFLDELDRYWGGCHCESGDGFDNVAACQAAEDTLNDLWCMDTDFDFSCDVYIDAYSDCNFVPYFDCLTDVYYCDSDGSLAVDHYVLDICMGPVLDEAMASCS